MALVKRSLLVQAWPLIAAGLMCSLPTWAQPAAGIPGVIAAGAVPELVQEGFSGLEGPVGAADGTLYFSDRDPDRTYRLGLDGKIGIVAENTGAANGLAMTRAGELVRAEGTGKKISKVDSAGRVTILTEGAPGRPLLAPNDAIVDARGGVYFTDPGPRPVVPGRPTGVFYLPPGARDAVLIDDKIGRPNGIALTPDGNMLLVDDTLSPTVFAYDVQPDGRVRNKRPFLQLRDTPAGEESGADGIAVDRDGRIYVTSVVGIQVFDRSGAYLGRFQAARRSQNIAFSGPDKRTLYFTAGPGLYRVRMLSQGPDRPGK
jgi:gluconolactonase